ncbi:MAG: 6-phosphogluconolactonase [Spirochaetales bacterium]|nr:6-phosphogluconolactonase [Spirochaetales bacterium]
MAGALIFNNYDDFCRQAAEHIYAILKLALVHKKRASIVLSGGSTPAGVYRYLADNQGDFNWEHVDFFIGDERCVPEDHAHSNYRMVEESFLSRIPHKNRNIYKVNQTLSPDEAALDYHKQIKNYLDKNNCFDLVLLGMGPDGHTASLFPGYPEVAEKRRLALATAAEGPLEPYHRRVTMTVPALNHSEHLLFLLKGGNEKKDIMDRVLRPGEKGREPEYPVQLIKPACGRAYWYFSK